MTKVLSTAYYIWPKFETGQNRTSQDQHLEINIKYALMIMMVTHDDENISHDDDDSNHADDDDSPDDDDSHDDDDDDQVHLPTPVYGRRWLSAGSTFKSNS